MSSATRTYSIVVEMENATTIHWRQVGEMFRAVAAQIGQLAVEIGAAKPQVLCVHPGSACDSDTLHKLVLEQAPELERLAEIRCVAIAEGRYYELKNGGITQATGDVVVLLDSDTMPEADWLRSLLEPFDDLKTVAVGGHTYLAHQCFVSRTLAMVWIFPLRNHDTRAANRRPLYSNNCAFRGNWIQANLYPDDCGFKVACTRLAHRLREDGHTPVRAPAYTRHAALSGIRFLVWRALVTGRDADRKIAALKSKSRLHRLVRAMSFGLKMQSRTARRVLALRRHVAMPAWQVPAALTVGSIFYGLALCGQVAQLSGFNSDQPERIPDYAEAT